MTVAWILLWRDLRQSLLEDTPSQQNMTIACQPQATRYRPAYALPGYSATPKTYPDHEDRSRAAVPET